MKGTLVLCVVLFLGARANSSIIVNSPGTVVNENFDSLAASGNDQSWTDNLTIPGWYWQSDGLDLPYDTDDGSNNASSPYSYGSDGSSDRAMGNLGGGDNDNTAWGVTLWNNSGETLDQWTVSFMGEQWRLANGQASDGLTVAYLISNSEITNYENTGGAVPAGWTEVSSLHFSDPQTSGTTGALDGNAVENRAALNDTLNIAVELGQYIAFRWYDADDASYDNGHGIDDVSIAAIPEPATLSFIILFGAGMLGLRRFFV